MFINNLPFCVLSCLVAAGNGDIAPSFHAFSLDDIWTGDLCYTLPVTDTYVVDSRDRPKVMSLPGSIG